MKVQSEKTGPCEFTLTIEVGQERTDKAMQVTARDIAKKAPVPGFRPGKAPYRIIESYFGKEVILNRALETLGQEVYEDALKEAELEPYAQGNLDVETQEPLVLKAVVPVQPVVELGDYRAIRQDVPGLDFDESEIDKALAELQQRKSTWSPVERAAQEGDQVIINLVGTVGDEEVLTQTNRRTLASPEMYPQGVYAHVVGLEPGGEVDYEIAFDEDDSNQQFAGQTVSFHLELVGVNEKELPELDDDFAKQIGGDYEDMEALRQGIKDSLHTSKEDELREEAASKVLLAVLEEASLEYPDVAVEREIDLQVHEIQQRLQGQGYTWEAYLNMQGKSEEEMRDEIRPGAEQNLRETLALQKIAELEGIQVDDDQVEAEIDKMVEPYGPQAEMFRTYFASEVNKLSIHRRLLLQKTLNWLLDMAAGTLEEPAEGDGEEESSEVTAEPSQEVEAAPDTAQEAVEANESAESEGE